MRRAAHSILAASLAAACGEAAAPQLPFEREQPNWAVVDEEIAPRVEENVKDADGVERLGGVWLIPVDVSFATALEAPVARAVAAELEAARAADDALFERLGPENLRIRRTVEEILRHGDALSGATRGRLERYLLALRVHHGTAPRAEGARTNAAGLLRPEFIPGELASAAELAARSGAAFDVPRSPSLLGADRVQEIEALMAAIRPAIFGRPDASEADAGAGAAEIATAPHEKIPALPKVEEAPGTCFLLGLGPAERGGEPRGLVGVPAKEEQRLLDAVSAKAAALDKIVRAQGGGKSVTEAAAKGRRTRAVRDIFAAGALGPLHGRGELWRMIDGPLVEVDAGGRGEVWLLTGAAAAFDGAVGRRIAGLYSRDEATARLRLEWRARTRLALLALREAAGRGTDGTETRPPGWIATHLGAHAELLAAMRADLAALYLALDPAAREIGIVASEECARALYEDYVGWAFESYGFGAPPQDLAAAAAARRAIARNLLAKGAIEVTGGDGKPGEWLRYGVTDLAAARRAVGELLAEVRRIRYVGDAVAAAAMIDTMRGSEARWQRDVEARYRTLDRPRAVGFLYPPLRAVRGNP